MLGRLTACLTERCSHAHPRTLRRPFFAQPSELYLLGPDHLLDVIRATHLCPLWQSLSARFHRDPVRIPLLQIENYC